MRLSNNSIKRSNFALLRGGVMACLCGSLEFIKTNHSIYCAYCFRTPDHPAQTLIKQDPKIHFRRERPTIKQPFEPKQNYLRRAATIIKRFQREEKRKRMKDFKMSTILIH